MGLHAGGFLQDMEKASDNVGQYTSVGIGSDGNPIISHRDDTNDDLELAIATVAVVGVGFE